MTDAARSFLTWSSASSSPPGQLGYPLPGLIREVFGKHRVDRATTTVLKPVGGERS